MGVKEILYPVVYSQRPFLPLRRITALVDHVILAIKLPLKAQRHLLERAGYPLTTFAGPAVSTLVESPTSSLVLSSSFVFFISWSCPDLFILKIRLRNLKASLIPVAYCLQLHVISYIHRGKIYVPGASGENGY